MKTGAKLILVRGVSAIKGLFGSDSSKSTKFGPEVDNATESTFLPGGRHFGKNQHGLHPVGYRSQV